MAAPNSAVTSVDFDDMKPGFAKLHGENFEYFMQDYSVILGHNTEKSKVHLDLSVLDGGGIHVSSRHARIFYDFEHHHFSLEVLSKHGCTIQGVSYPRGSDPVKLNSQDHIEIAGRKFYFLLPTRSVTASVVARRAHTSLAPQSSSFVPDHPGSSCTGDYGFSNSDKGIKNDNDMRGKLMKRSRKSSGELGISNSNSSGVNADPIRTLGEFVNKLEIPRADKDTDNQLSITAEKDTKDQRLQTEEKAVVSSIASLISDLCGPGDWVPMEKLHSEVLGRFGKSWSRDMVRRYLTKKGGSRSSSETKGRPWRSLLTLLKKYPEHFVIATMTRGEVVVSEYAGLVSLVS